MAYRPHFAYATPLGMVDENADYPFDYRQAAGNIPATGSYSLTLALDSDADFLWRSLLWVYPIPVFFLAGQVAARIKDPYGNYLSNDFVPLMILGGPQYTAQPWTGVNAATPPAGLELCAPFSVGMGCPLVDEIFCPRSSTLSIDLFLFNAGVSPNAVGRMLARGVKRRKLADCASEYR